MLSSLRVSGDLLDFEIETLLNLKEINDVKIKHDKIREFSDINSCWKI